MSLRAHELRQDYKLLQIFAQSWKLAKALGPSHVKRLFNFWALSYSVVVQLEREEETGVTLYALTLQDRPGLF